MSLANILASDGKINPTFVSGGGSGPVAPIPTAVQLRTNNATNGKTLAPV